MSVSGTPPPLEYWEVVVRLVVSFALGAIIGLEREIDHKAAGITTHALVTVGTALFSMASAYAYHSFDVAAGTSVTDPSRISGQIVNGIGFLGAGAIIKEGWNIKGLTTAACLWVCAGIGLSMGVNFWFPAVVATFVTVFGLIICKRLEMFIAIARVDVYVEDCTRDEVAALAKELLSAGILIDKVDLINKTILVKDEDTGEEIEQTTNRFEAKITLSNLGKVAPKSIAMLVIKVLGPEKSFSTTAHSPRKNIKTFIRGLRRRKRTQSSQRRAIVPTETVENLHFGNIDQLGGNTSNGGNNSNSSNSSETQRARSITSEHHFQYC